jgi:hypothetical protein
MFDHADVSGEVIVGLDERTSGQAMVDPERMRDVRERLRSKSRKGIAIAV